MSQIDSKEKKQAIVFPEDSFDFQRVSRSKPQAKKPQAKESRAKEPRIKEPKVKAAKEKEVRVKEPKTKKRTGRLISVILGVMIVVLACALVYQGYVLIRYYIDINANQENSAQATDVFTEAGAAIADETPAPEAPVVPTPLDGPIQPGILALREEFQNDDIVGYITIADTNIQHAVAQTEDNDFYIIHGLDKQTNAAGAVFMDSSNNPQITDYNTVIYGHNMRNGAMFHNLQYYNDKRYFDAHKTIIYYSLYEEMTWEVFSFYPTSTDFDYIRTVFDSHESYEEFLAEIQMRSVVEPEVAVTGSDVILTLSTCTNTDDNMRYALHARLVERK